MKKSRPEPPSTSVGSVRLTNPDKLLYPEAGITKRHLAEYYERVSRWMLPHVSGRPVTFVRCLNGWTRPGFFQKHAAGGLAQGVRVFEWGDSDVLVVDDATTLVALAQMCVLEVHVWGAHVDALERPDLLVFDLDPDVEVPWSEVVSAALEVRQRLVRLGHEPCVKTTGGKGLHVCSRPPRRMTWHEAREIGRALGETMAADAPGRFLTSISKAKRKGKILLDFSRNHPQATFVAPYSPRARAGATVAMPLSWDELEGSRPAAYTITNAVERLEKLGDPWAPIAGRLP